MSCVRRSVSVRGLASHLAAVMSRKCAPGAMNWSFITHQLTVFSVTEHPSTKITCQRSTAAHTAHSNHGQHHGQQPFEKSFKCSSFLCLTVKSNWLVHNSVFFIFWGSSTNSFARHFENPGDTGMTSNVKKERDQKLKIQAVQNEDEWISCLATKNLPEILPTKKQCSGGSVSLVFTCNGLWQRRSLSYSPGSLLSLSLQGYRYNMQLGTASHELWEKVQVAYLQSVAKVQATWLTCGDEREVAEAVFLNLFASWAFSVRLPEWNRKSHSLQATQVREPMKLITNQWNNDSHICGI